jgi:hypothetical protein
MVGVHRPFGHLVVGILVAMALLLRAVQPEPLSSPSMTAGSAPATVAIGSRTAAPTAVVAEAATIREAVVPTIAPAPRDESEPDLTFHLTGASPAELRGMAFVRRKDGSSSELPFEGGCFRVEDRTSLDGVSLRVPGFAITWPELGTGALELDVPMQRAGLIRVRLVDTQGRPLAHRVVGTMCQRATATASPGVSHQANPRGCTDGDGVACIEHALPGVHEVFAARVAEWQTTRVSGVEVRAGEVATCELVAATIPPSRCGGFRFPRAAAPVLEGKENSVHSHVFATAAGHRYELAFLGDEVRCIVPGQPGDLISGSIVPTGVAGDSLALAPSSAPITVTVGAVVEWHPIWVR